MSKELVSVPRELVAQLRESILQEPTKVRAKEIIHREFELHHGQAMAHAITKQEHDGLMAVHFYIIWKKKLWESEYEHWGEYCAEVSRLPYGPSERNIKGKVTDIDDLVKRGVSFDGIVASMGKFPSAVHELLAASEETLPRPIGTIIDEMDGGELSSREAAKHVGEIIGKPSIYCTEAVYIAKDDRILANIVIDSPTHGKKDSDFEIRGVDSEQIADWLMSKLGARDKTKR